ncbi:cupredoxin domain-containing protein [Candidatus Methylacidithermus pantelleriae]|uniref:Cytochrome c oxidase, subunit 2 n=1 Tax=Candidatus Methylacidithermus pantelleriae TaxID=2744239 RepID=A0A8J2BK32_9BACT|nr:cytochrome C oxidase subunit II [Candidatus Methylacidithermus pantelleriae]CAF0691889.1 Cytochrome c oxidase, subunit 2 [Candidatus Methylacidithermus pantelleriae]
MVEKIERVYVWACIVLLISLFGLIILASALFHRSLPYSSQPILPRPNEPLILRVYQTSPFQAPGVHQVGPGIVQAAIVAQAWSFNPPRLEIPTKTRVLFIATSADVTHGLIIPGTPINMMLIPGHVTQELYQFDRPGIYPMICHEYCGLFHQDMTGEILVR